MADYIPITDNELLPDQPIPSLLGLRWRDNMLAIAEGAPGAPKLNIGMGKLSSPNPQSATGIVGLSGVGLISGFVNSQTNGASGTYLRVRYSSNDGASWGAWQNLYQLTSGVTSSASFMLDFLDGTWFSSSGYTSVNVSTQVPSGCNGFQFSIATGNTGGIAGIAWKGRGV